MLESSRQRHRTYTNRLHIRSANHLSRYYQPNPNAPTPFTVNSAINDPVFPTTCPSPGRCDEAWGLRIVSSKNIFIYAAGLYSFFINNNGTTSKLFISSFTSTPVS